MPTGGAPGSGVASCGCPMTPRTPAAGRRSFAQPEIYYAGPAAAFVTAGALITARLPAALQARATKIPYTCPAATPA
jgi:hypothetical protein